MNKIDWIDISEIKKYNPKKSILIWQKNLSDDESSRFQRAVWYEDSHIDVYPLTHRTTFDLLESGIYEGYDLEGDLCIVTHFAFVQKP